MDIQYSREFQKIIRNKRKMKQLIKQNGIIDNLTFKKWEEMRYFIVNSINSDGTILDIGCTNGLLLKTLQEWSKYKLEPYGIDYNPELIREARILHKIKQNNFATIDVTEIKKITKHKLPSQYDYIYWNLWTNWDLKNKTQINTMKEVLKMIGNNGRLILGFYNLKNLRELIRIIRRLNRIGFSQKIIQRNPAGSEVILYGCNTR